MRVCLAVGDVESHRADRRAQACADAVAVHRLQVGDAIGGIAGVDERGDPPGGRDPAHDFDAADRVVAAADRRIADAGPEAVERVTPHGRIAAGPEQQRDRHVARAACGDGAAFAL